MASPSRKVRFRTVPAFCAPLIGSNSASRAATLPNGAETVQKVGECYGTARSL